MLFLRNLAQQIILPNLAQQIILRSLAQQGILRSLAQHKEFSASKKLYLLVWNGRTYTLFAFICALGKS